MPVMDPTIITEYCALDDNFGTKTAVVMIF